MQSCVTECSSYSTALECFEARGGEGGGGKGGGEKESFKRGGERG